MNLERLAAAMSASGGSHPSIASTAIADLAYRTSAVEPGALFFCVPGSRVDGHDLAPEAVTRGAAQLVVEDVRRAMPQAAVEFFGDPTRELEVAAVTGTAGKTTTVYLLHAILEA